MQHLNYTDFLIFWVGGVCGYGLCLFIWNRHINRNKP